jgi:hypothetical protein
MTRNVQQQQKASASDVFVAFITWYGVTTSFDPLI